MTIKIGINGLGRIGRMVIRSLIESKNKNIEIKHINNRSNSETATLLLKRDSVHGQLIADLDFGDNHIKINNKKIPYGGTFLIFSDYCKPSIRLAALMKQRVIYVMTHDSIGLGEDGPTHQPIEQLSSLRAIPNLNLFRPADTIETFETWQLALENQVTPSIIALTRQKINPRLLDNSHKDPRRARSAGQSIVPTSTGASKALGEIIPELKGKLEGLAIRVPTPNVSLVDLVFNSKSKLSVKKINDSFIRASKKELKNVLEATEEKLVSIDFNHNPNSAIVDLSLTNVVGNNMGKVSAWYDNEWGFASRMCDLAEYIHKI